MSRLPIFFVFDLDESFIKTHHLELVKNLVDDCIKELRGDPHALEIAHISIVTFDGERKIVYPMAEILDFSMPEITPGKGEMFGPCLEALMDEISRQVLRTTVQTKGDHKPICVIFTDSEKADGTCDLILRWRREFKYADVVVYTIGQKPDLATFVQLTPEVIRLEYTYFSPCMFIKRIMFDWVEASIMSDSSYSK